MGWSNLFIEINNDLDLLERVEQFVKHHNEFKTQLSKDELLKIDSGKSYGPGSPLYFHIIKNEVNNTYWGLLSNSSGMWYTLCWLKQYFPPNYLTFFQANEWIWYNHHINTVNHWINWPYFTIEQYKLQLLRQQSKLEEKLAIKS